MAEPAVQKTIRLPLDLNRRLEEEARRTGTAQTDIIIKALEAYLRGEGKENGNA